MFDANINTTLVYKYNHLQTNTLQYHHFLFSFLSTKLISGVCFISYKVIFLFNILECLMIKSLSRFWSASFSYFLLWIFIFFSFSLNYSSLTWSFSLHSYSPYSTKYFDTLDFTVGIENIVDIISCSVSLSFLKL